MNSFNPGAWHEQKGEKILKELETLELIMPMATL